VSSSSEPNPAIQFQDWVALERSQDYASDLEQFVADVYQEICVTGVFAVLNSVKSSIKFPSGWAADGYVYVQDNFKFVVYAAKGECPGFQ
jgi:hypothetical protein